MLPKKQISFATGTLIEMAGGSTKAIEQIELGDITRGGEVFGTMRIKVTPGAMYYYKGIWTTGSNPVNDDGVWRYVFESPHAKKALDTENNVTYTLACETHRIFVDGVEFVDYPETYDNDPLLVSYVEELLVHQNSAVKNI